MEELTPFTAGRGFPQLPAACLPPMLSQLAEEESMEIKSNIHPRNVEFGFPSSLGDTLATWVNRSPHDGHRTAAAVAMSHGSGMVSGQLPVLVSFLWL